MTLAAEETRAGSCGHEGERCRPVSPPHQPRRPPDVNSTLTEAAGSCSVVPSNVTREESQALVPEKPGLQSVQCKTPSGLPWQNKSRHSNRSVPQWQRPTRTGVNKMRFYLAPLGIEA